MNLKKIIHEEIDIFNKDLLDVTIEGVADKYAEKRFNIPDPNTAQNLLAYQSLLGKPYAVINLRSGIGNQRVPIYKNPQTLEGFDAEVRAIALNNGDLYVMQIDADVMHGKMGNNIGLTDVYDSDDNVLLHRVGNRNAFGFGDSASGYVQENPRNWEISVEILRMTKKMNPQFDYYPIYFKDVKNLKIEPVDADGNDEYDEPIEFDADGEPINADNDADNYNEPVDADYGKPVDADYGKPVDADYGKPVDVNNYNESIANNSQ